MERNSTSRENRSGGSLTRLIDLILERAETGGGWTVSSDEIMRQTGIPTADFYRVMYGMRSRISFSDGIRGFGSENVGELVTLLEAFFGPDVENALSEAGVFLPHARRIEATDIFIAEVQRVSSAHRIEYDTFWRMVEVFRDFGKAFSVYLDEYFPADRLISTAAGIFRTRVDGGPLHEKLAEDYLRLLFTRHILGRRELFSWLERAFVTSGFERGYFTRRERRSPWEENGDGANRGRTTGGGSDTRDALASAKAVLGFANGALSADLIKKRYRELVRKYHPDVNPSGLEMCKKITGAYSLLIAEYGP